MSGAGPGPTLGPRRLLAGALALSALGLVTACGSTTDAPVGAGSVATTPSDAERLAGRYAHYDVVAYEGDGMKTLIIAYGFTDLDVVDGGLEARETFCSSEHRSDQPISVEMPDVATQAIKPVPAPVTMRATDDGVHLSRPATPTPLGIDLEDPANEPLPTDPNDPRIIDADGDGNPGVTAHITVGDSISGDLYLARREIFAYEVDEQPDGSLIGHVVDDSEQLVVGASNPIFLTEAQWVQVEDPSKNPIILLPVDDDWDCERLMAERDRIFPPTPEVDW